MPKRALITGITGQDSAYLAQHLLSLGYDVYGTYRRNSSLNLWRLTELGIEPDVRLIPLELLEITNILRAFDKIQPDEVYNLAAQSFVAASFDEPIHTSDINALGVARILETIRSSFKGVRFYQASTSEMFGKVRETPQSETTPFYPRSPYAVAKAYAHWLTVNYREAYGIHASSGILFNHESPLRGMEFVTRKVTASLARIKYGLLETLELGNLESKRDWGFAGDYVRGMHLMLQQQSGDDYVLATGDSHSVREFIMIAAEIMGFRLEWRGTDAETEAVDARTSRVVIRVNPRFYRPTEVEVLQGDSGKARERLGWYPQVRFEQLVEMMASADMHRVSRGHLVQ